MKAEPKTMTRIAVMTAVMCILGPISIPTGIVPISFTPLAVFLSVYILGTAEGTAATALYILIGAVGLPVFSGFQGGFAKIAGPTGGYILGFIFMAAIGGFFIHRYYEKIWLQFIGMLLGLAVLYAFGTAWLSFTAHMSFAEALSVGVLPFIAVDIIKIAVSILLGRAVRTRLARSGIIA